MRKNSPINRALLFSYIGLVIFVLSLQLSLHFLPDIIAKNAKGQNLQGSWKSCWTFGQEKVGSCQWTETHFPGSVAKPKGKGNALLHLQRTFQRPGICNEKLDLCSLFIGTVSDPAAVYLNGRLIGTVGSPGTSKSYTQTFPITLSIPPDAFAETNILKIEIFPNYLGNQGLIRGPIHLFSFETASWISRIIIAQTIALPLISGVILLLLVFITLLVCACARVWDPKAKAFAGYCLTMGLYLISLTRLPREVLPPQFGIALHFALRLITEYFQLALVTSLFDRKIRGVSAAQVYCLTLACLLLFPATTSLLGWELNVISDFGRSMYRFSVLLYVIPPILCIFLIYQSDADRRKVYIPLGSLYAIVCLMIFSDYLAINGWIEDIYFVRFYPVLVALGYCSALWMSYSQLRQTHATNFALGELAAQVAHDIRSPLMALNVALEDLTHLSESKRNLARSAVARVRDIANGLMVRQRGLSLQESSSFESALEKDAIGAHLIAPFVENLVTENRLAWRGRLGLEIRLDLARDSYGLFAQIQTTEFGRVLSNLINNSVEAIPKAGCVVVSVRGTIGSVEISVSDNGIGIASENILKLGCRGVTFGKKEGTGLGLFHAKRTIESWNGELTVESQLGQGTKVKLILPRTPAPKWFVDGIVIGKDQTVVIVDDDISVHQMWHERLREITYPGMEVREVHLSNVEELSHYVASEAAGPGTLFLVDHHFAGTPGAGLQSINSFKLAEQSILVTSQHDEPSLISDCLRMGVSLLPKTMAGFIPIAFAE